MSQVMLKGDPVSIGGTFPQVGDDVKDFNLANNKREDVTLEIFSGQKKVINIFPALIRQHALYPLSDSIKKLATYLIQ